MNRLKWKWSFLLYVIVLLNCSIPAAAYTDYNEELNYIYNKSGRAIGIPTAYEYKDSISLKNLNIEEADITGPVDMFVKENGELFVVDSILGAIIVFDENLNFVKLMTEFFLEDGSITTLNKPEGIFVTKSDIIYIADTDNKRILVCNREGNIIQEIQRPKNLLGTNISSFLPTKVVVDSVGRISVVARNINNGIMQFNNKGEFIGYTGAPTVNVDAFSKLLRKISTDAQRNRMQYYVPTEYNNIKIDSKNFIWGTISSLSADAVTQVINGKDLSGKITPIKKINTTGIDILRRRGIYPPIGELRFTEMPSKITDVGIGANKIYSLLDSYYGKVFTYNNDGVLLHAFGNKGTKMGNMMTPVAIDYIENEIYVLDAGLCEIIIYSPTTYGQMLIDAEGYYHAGNYELANTLWKSVAERNSNFEYAYAGLGNTEFEDGQYSEAMKYYKYADESKKYSDAMEILRKQWAETIFPIVFIIILISMVSFILITIYSKFRRYVQGEVYINHKQEDDE